MPIAWRSLLTTSLCLQISDLLLQSILLTWLMSQGYQIYDQNKLHYLTFQIVQWVDVFTRNEYKQIIVNSFDYLQKA